MVHIKLEQFEGPLALLVKLIDQSELDITQVSLARVADQYIAHLKTLTDLDPEEMADFLVVASRLLLVKAKALLPYLLPEEEEAIEDLEEQLRMYKEFLEATKHLEEMVAQKRFMFGRSFNRKALIANLGVFAPPPKLRAPDLARIFEEIIKAIAPAVKPLPERTLVKAVSIEEKIFLITKTLTEKLRARFSSFFSQSAPKVEIIVSFLAMLELMKQRTIQAEQGELFSEIEIAKL